MIIQSYLCTYNAPVLNDGGTTVIEAVHLLDERSEESQVQPDVRLVLDLRCSWYSLAIATVLKILAAINDL